MVYQPYAAPVQELYQDDPRIWNCVFELVVRDLALCEKEGINLPGNSGKIFPIILGQKGDWSYLVPCYITQRLFVFQGSPYM